jgi:putative endonuclease
MNDLRRTTGLAGEQLAASWLERAGLRILCRNYRCAGGEIDLVAEERGELVFVEVRTRRSGGMVSPEESVDSRKQRRIVRTAEHYLQSIGGHDRAWRIDVVAVEVDRAGRVERLDHLRSVVS